MNFTWYKIRIVRSSNDHTETANEPLRSTGDQFRQDFLSGIHRVGLVKTLLYIEMHSSLFEERALMSGEEPFSSRQVDNQDNCNWYLFTYSLSDLSLVPEVFFSEISPNCSQRYANLEGFYIRIENEWRRKKMSWLSLNK